MIPHIQIHNNFVAVLFPKCTTATMYHWLEKTPQICEEHGIYDILLKQSASLILRDNFVDAQGQLVVPDQAIPIVPPLPPLPAARVSRTSLQIENYESLKSDHFYMKNFANKHRQLKQLFLKSLSEEMKTATAAVQQTAGTIYDGVKRYSMSGGNHSIASQMLKQLDLFGWEYTAISFVSMVKRLNLVFKDLKYAGKPRTEDVKN